MKERAGLPWLAWLPLGWYGVFLFGPLILVGLTSLATRGLYGGIEWTWSASNFARAIDPLYIQILFRSVWLALITTVLCFALGLPVALTMATSGAGARRVLIFFLAVPFLTNLVIRVCALKTITAVDGPLSHLLTWLSIEHDPFALSQNTALVLIGMVSTYLPFMVFPLYSALERFDFSLFEAAEDLGSRFMQTLWRVVFPNLRKAIASGLLLVFIPALGEFVIPDLLGGAKTMLSGNLISEQFLKARDWPFGSALSVLFLAILMLGILLIRLWGGGEEEA